LEHVGSKSRLVKSRVVLIKRFHGRRKRPVREKRRALRIMRYEDVTMKGHEFTPDETSAVAAIGDGIPETDESTRVRWQTRADVDWHRAETERLRVLVDFLARPICAHGGAEPDPDIVTAYNLAVEAALRGIRLAALGRP
jgi:hypothetical protein